MVQGSASLIINRPPDVVFAAITDITRTGEWSPECTGCRWVGGATEPTVGAKFEGDNKVVVAGITMKRWTTTSEITACELGKVFEFVAEGYTTWRYEFEAAGEGTRVTESYSFTSSGGAQKFIYETLLRRPEAMIKGMQKTLERIKAAVEA